MFDIQHDSAVPIHEQITNQIRANIASEALMPGTVLAEYRALSQELLTNPQVVSRAYADLEAEGVLARSESGSVIVGVNAVKICRAKLQESARDRVRQAIALAVAWGLSDEEIADTVSQALSVSRSQPLSADEVLQAIKKQTHERSDRVAQGIQDLSRQGRAGRP